MRDEERGEWQFFVSHFSRWGFDDSFFDDIAQGEEKGGGGPEQNHPYDHLNYSGSIEKIEHATMRESGVHPFGSRGGAGSSHK